MQRYYLIDNAVEMNRRDFENFILDFICKNNLFELIGWTNYTTVERKVRNRPFAYSKRLGFNVVTYTK